MESHAVKYPGRQVFFVRTNAPLLPDMGNGVVRHQIGTIVPAKKVRRTPRESATASVLGFSVGEEAWCEMVRIGR